MEFNYDKSVSNAHLEAAGWGMDAFNHSNPFESHVINVLDYRNDHIRLFTIKLAPALVGYAKSTETYRSWRRVSGATELLVFSSQVKSMDVSNHPERFRGRR